MYIIIVVVVIVVIVVFTRMPGELPQSFYFILFFYSFCSLCSCHDFRTMINSPCLLIFQIACNSTCLIFTYVPLNRTKK